jgi:CTD nuclear envelope phosphatase 1
MNSLNIISSRVSPSSSPAPSRSNSLGTLGLAVKQATDREHDRDNAPPVSDTDTLVAEPDDGFPVEHPRSDEDEKHPVQLDEGTPLLAHAVTGFKNPDSRSSGWVSIPKRIATGFINSIQWVLSALAAPGVYLIACLYDVDGNFAPLLRLTRSFGGRRKEKDYAETVDEKARELVASSTSSRGGRPLSLYSSSSGVSSESESDRDANRTALTSGSKTSNSSSSSRHGRSKSLQPTEEIAPSRRSIRIKLHSEDALRQRKHKKSQSSSARDSNLAPNDISAQLKSPTSPVAALTKYPRTPAPPRPLIPRRQPSYVNAEPVDARHQKTLILDLDETLIHSMSKGGRMSSGHMVEVRLATTYVGVGGQASLGPQHPILYYVHKRPHCDDFLRRVCVMPC